ncbi:MAG: hypothetical protein AABZ60_21715 [Planctomycetota bacterium]
MSKFEMISVQCQGCGFVTEVFHRIVPPDQLDKPDLLGLEKVAGCKAVEQKLICPHCQKSQFLPLPVD